MIDHNPDVVRIGGHQVERSTLKGIQTASVDSGVSFHYLLAKAAQESGFDSDAEANTSSATGLFQFTRGTWLDMMRRHGEELGLSELASQVKESATGRLTVLNEDVEIQMLALRRDPDISSRMAALFAGDNASTLKTALGRDATPGDLYLAHFLGAWGATALMTAAEQEPDKPAVELMPAAAHANKNVFFEDSGSARSAKGVIDWLKDKFSERLDETADIASIFNPQNTQRWIADESKPLSGSSNSIFDFSEAASIDDGTRMGISLHMLQMLSEMMSVQPMQMVDDPFAIQPSGFSGGSWNNLLTEVFNSNSQQSAAAAGRAYQESSNAATALRQGRSA